MEISALFNIYSLAFTARQRALAILSESYLDSYIKLLLCEYITYLGKILELTTLLSAAAVATTPPTDLESKMLLHATKECARLEDELNLKNICFVIH